MERVYNLRPSAREIGEIFEDFHKSARDCQLPLVSFMVIRKKREIATGEKRAT